MQVERYNSVATANGYGPDAVVVHKSSPQGKALPLPTLEWGKETGLGFVQLYDQSLEDQANAIFAQAVLEELGQEAAERVLNQKSSFFSSNCRRFTYGVMAVIGVISTISAIASKHNI